MARSWIGDIHFGHKLVAGIRYPDAPQDERLIVHHDMVIYDQLKSLSPNDEVFILGDISSGKPEQEDRALELLNDIQADLHLIAGNHDSVSSIHRNGYKQQKRWLKTFATVRDFARIRLYGKDVLMSHYPYARSGDGPERGEARYLEYRLPDTGLSLIHAHTHQTTPHMDRWVYDYVLQESVNFGSDTQQYCVSWDVHRGLVTEQQLTEWIQNNGMKKR